MTDQQHGPTLAELGAKFGAQQAQTFCDFIVLEKLLAEQRLQIQSMIKLEETLVKNIQDLEFELDQQKAGCLALEAKYNAVMDSALAEDMQTIATEADDGHKVRTEPGELSSNDPGTAI